MEMGRAAIDPVVMPDTYGLPIYKVTKVIKQKVGDDVHMLCGAEIFGQTQWLYIVTMSAADLLREASDAMDVAYGNSTTLTLRIGRDH